MRTQDAHEDRFPPLIGLSDSVIASTVLDEPLEDMAQETSLVEIRISSIEDQVALLSSNLHCTCSEERGLWPLLLSSTISTDLEDEALKRRMSIAV